jgi:adenylate cyclase
MAREVAAAHLLVVDDNKVNRLLLGRGLEAQGHTVDFATNGREALAKLRSGAFDLLLLDIQMPEMDGYQVLEELARDLRLRDLPVIVTSALEELDSVVRCIEMGAEDYLTKPVNPVLLRARIGASLEKKRLRDQQRELVRKFATAEVATDLEASGFALGGKYVEATAMFSDIRSFTAIAAAQPPDETIELLNDYYTLMFEAITGQGGVVNQMVGDGLMAIFGAPLPLEGRCARAVFAALEMQEMVALFNAEQEAQGKPTIRIGIGIASGQVIAGYTGTQRRATYTCAGDTVNLAARLEAHTKVVGRPILIDEATWVGLGGVAPTEPLGPTEVRGIGTVAVYVVPSGPAEAGLGWR